MRLGVRFIIVAQWTIVLFCGKMTRWLFHKHVQILSPLIDGVAFEFVFDAQHTILERTVC